MHMLHVTHLLHILYWIKIWTPAYTAISDAKIQLLNIENRVVNLHSSIWRFPFLQRRHAILNISFDQPETILRQRVYIHLSLHPEKVTECKLPFLINSATDSLDIRYGLSKLRITNRKPEVYRKWTNIFIASVKPFKSKNLR